MLCLGVLGEYAPAGSCGRIRARRSSPVYEELGERIRRRHGNEDAAPALLVAFVVGNVSFAVARGETGQDT